MTEEISSFRWSAMSAAFLLIFIMQGETLDCLDGCNFGFVPWFPAFEELISS
jgi:hypothetical protein